MGDPGKAILSWLLPPRVNNNMKTNNNNIRSVKNKNTIPLGFKHFFESRYQRTRSDKSVHRTHATLWIQNEFSEAITLWQALAASNIMQSYSVASSSSLMHCSRSIERCGPCGQYATILQEGGGVEILAILLNCWQLRRFGEQWKLYNLVSSHWIARI